ncbi:MAG: N-acetylneuraminate synthase [Ignavibacteriae bacterium]|nr:N-acetylneuraminate synthase [Ignavibacteriota bacterium]
MHVKIIAEAGVNHNGDINLAKELVAAAAEAGADIVKFQTFKAENLVTKSAEKANYQKDTSGSDETQFEMLKKLELDENMYHEIINVCRKNNIQFLSTAFDKVSLDFLVNNIGLKTLKIPSGEITNGPFIHDHAKTNAKLILSTGMATLGEIEDALAVIAHGYCIPETKISSLENCYKVLISPEGRKSIEENVSLLHCTSSYPAPAESVNLNAMDTLKNAFNLNTGYSDHTLGITASIAAVAKGASIIEKHFTLDKNMKRPDHKASLNPNELNEMVNAIREVSKMLGDGRKLPDINEIDTKKVARKSILAAKRINTGETLNLENMTIKRPGLGISPMEWWSLQNSIAHKDYSEDDFIE